MVCLDEEESTLFPPDEFDDVSGHIEKRVQDRKELLTKVKYASYMSYYEEKQHPLLVTWYIFAM